jgi:hypothetical protein
MLTVLGKAGKISSQPLSLRSQKSNSMMLYCHDALLQLDSGLARSHDSARRGASHVLGPVVLLFEHRVGADEGDAL